MSSVSDVDGPFTSNNANGKYGTEDAFGGKVQLGWDFGKIRADIKVTAHESGIDDVNGASASRDDFWFGSATLNGYYDVLQYDLGEQLSITPFIGAGVRAAGGFIRASANLNSVLRRDHRYDIGLAGRVNPGVQLNVTESIALTLGYDFLAADVGDNVTYVHSGELGLRFTF